MESLLDLGDQKHKISDQIEETVKRIMMKASSERSNRKRILMDMSYYQRTTEEVAFEIYAKRGV